MANKAGRVLDMGRENSSWRGKGIAGGRKPMEGEKIDRKEKRF